MISMLLVFVVLIPILFNWCHLLKIRLTMADCNGEFEFGWEMGVEIKFPHEKCFSHTQYSIRPKKHAVTAKNTPGDVTQGICAPAGAWTSK